jgi:hypothetical protein
MPSTFTTNKGIEKPASGDYVNAWAAPVNVDWDDIDTALGGTATINVTGVTAGTYALTLAQYRPINIEFTGTISANLVYQIPTGIGGLWTIYNATSGAFTVILSIAGGNALNLPQGSRTLVVSDGALIANAQTLITTFAQLSGQILDGQVPVGAVTQWQASLALSMGQVSGSLPVGQLPANAYRGSLGSGIVTVQSGGSPSGGSSGDLVLIY